ncbi:ATP-dependent DNA helicase [Rhodococcus sp. 06-462-5]|uniref:ATP-dependent helicase n=1 Tax=unclassified Rhodococcus (in: high G+C Gram-positive bacteria) TaxID=192944 RepID=UPI000B9BD90E|nr:MULTISPECIES: UvrD-helicase domain-containing protein [unclassified Rhodococcus (in: high G+C Gram-positive bacteria)]OZC70353.1 ATP-dependent DNA helicase [Rhodococcus sp. 06-462-5]OZE69285.1 ATP-dependent DNA helicase [Rhodococcus sp. 02-925g]
MTTATKARTGSVRVSPVELARALGQKHPPTDEQAAVIAAPPGPTLVVAGAGAGKTETMAARVVWMVANGFVDPDQVLGLTFTRKAAQQLTSRIRARLARLAGSDLVRALDPSLALRERILGAEPEVSTYHSYAGRLLTEHGLLLPIEPSATLLSETELWQLAHRVVSTWDGDLDTDRNPTSVTEAVLALSGQLAEHLVDAEDLRHAHVELEKLVHTLGPGPRQRGGPTKELLNILDAQHQRIGLLPLVERLAQTLRREGALDFGSQMSMAARVAAEHAEVGIAERQRFRLVLLDEYQDTGHAQRVLLSSLFGSGNDPHLALTAVGDPMQSIYGWRGASAANLPRFATDFPKADGSPAPRLELLTSWRNPPEALTLANLITDPLRRVGVPVPTLRARPGAIPGDVRLAVTDTVPDEREWIADRIAGEYRAALEQDRTPPTAAVLVRRNADAEPIAEVLRSRGLPVEVVGLGGLLHVPEVADVIAMLRLVADPTAGSSAMRILTGSRWQIGPTDLRALSQRARELEIRGGYGTAGRVDDPEALEAALGSVLPGEQSEQAGLADAIADPGPAERYSEVGQRRIVALAGELHLLRDRIGQPLTELVGDIERIMGIGVEAQARTPISTDGAVGREHLDEFAHVVADYADNPTATVTGFLSFLAAAETVEDGLAPGEVDVAPHRVQVLTVHSAKGLEWEVVAVPHVAKGVFPSSNASSTWLGAMAELPPSLRGDRALDGEGSEGVPVLELEGLHNRKELEDAVKRHKDALARRRLAEDRRLFYVALTRTERVLLVSAHHWDETSTKPRGPSEFLDELHTHIEEFADIAVIEQWAPAPEDETSNPLGAVPHTASWPRDPLGPRRGAIESGAQEVLRALADISATPSEDDGTDDRIQEDPENWAADVHTLLAERAARSVAGVDVALPGNLSVTQLVDLAADPDALASRLRRPLPFPPNPLARRGTAFHAWIERRFGATRLLDLDELPGSADTGASADVDLETLQQAFLESEWSLRSPVEVEVPFETSVAGTVLRGRIDAVFADPDGGWTVVDWKTGAEPTASEQRAVAMQLAAYRLAWAELMSIGRAEPVPLDRVRAAFHYVRSGLTISPENLPDATELAQLLEGPAGPEQPGATVRSDEPSEPR